MDKIEKIRQEIERRIVNCKEQEHLAWEDSPSADEDAMWWQGGWKALQRLLAFIDSLQQEQPRVDLEKEIERFLESEESTSHTNAGGYDVAFKDTIKIARHFYELGKAKKED